MAWKLHDTYGWKVETFQSPQKAIMVCRCMAWTQGTQGNAPSKRKVVYEVVQQGGKNDG